VQSCSFRADLISGVPPCFSSADARDDTPYAQLAQELQMADQAISTARFAGDAVLAAFLRERVREHYRADLDKYLNQGAGGAGLELDGAARALRKQEKPVVPFHWEIEFPKVFDLDDVLRVSGGFDAIIAGNSSSKIGASKESCAARSDWPVLNAHRRSRC
jgi:hypothetical protein